jgi:hypothetical protein
MAENEATSGRLGKHSYFSHNFGSVSTSVFLFSKCSARPEEKKVAPAGSFCWNEGCADYGQVGKGKIIKNGKTDTGVQRYRCPTWTQTFTETKGTMFYRCRHSQETIVACLAMVGDRNSLVVQKAEDNLFSAHRVCLGDIKKSSLVSL